MKREILYIIIGYLSGSILFARLAEQIFHLDIVDNTKDKNPGAGNAFAKGGIMVGSLVLAGDLMKGFLPVWLYMQRGDVNNRFLWMILAAPVIGHIFSVFSDFKGGKGIAVTFGSFLGLYPFMEPVLIFAAVFIFYSLVLQISPHFYRTLAAYWTALVVFLLARIPAEIIAGFVVINAAVGIRMHKSHEEREIVKVKFLWKH